jgi:hypothetical protein
MNDIVKIAIGVAIGYAVMSYFGIASEDAKRRWERETKNDARIMPVPFTGFYDKESDKIVIAPDKREPWNNRNHTGIIPYGYPEPRR